MSQLVSMLLGRLMPREDGAVGWLALGILLGAILVIIAIVQLLIPGD
jgi:hypothetical protein